MNGPGLYEFLIEAELQQYYNSIKNDLKVQNVAQLKYVSEDDMHQIGMSRPETRRLKKYFHKHCPQTYLAKMKKKLLSRGENPITVASLSSNSQSLSGRSVRSVAPGRHIIQAESIVIHKTLGSGEFGTVQQGVWTAGDDGQRIQVAIKCLSQERMENNPVEFLKEAAIMHTVDHEHVVRLYGVVLDTAALMLVTELAPLRSLLECLKEPSMRPNLSVPTLCDFAVQICDGMQYLESKRLIHRDLAARNILVFSRSKVKISDFGLSRALGVGKDYYQTNFNVNLKLPIAWCAPECINFLRFTSASDVWAYGVTLWEMFSYGFQPWAALTGQQILEAIDEPNYQRLEKPECCPNEIYYQVMVKCWAHEPQNRPTFTVQLSNLLPENTPEQVQAIRESETRARRDFLLYDAGDIITVLDKKPAQGSDEGIGVLWKGVLKCGKSGLFNPANTITYLASSLPSVKQSQSPFHRNDSKNSSLRKGRLSVDMISGPQGDLKHTGHVGTDGQFFGDITFLGSKCWVPRQVVSPYKPESVSSDISGASTPVARFQSQSGSSSSSKCLQDPHEIPSSDTAPLLSTAAQMNTDGSSSGMRRRMHMNAPVNLGYGGTALDPDHEYHEISDEENEMMARGGGEMAIGLSNPALSSKSQSPLESPRFEKPFDLDLGGPSLIDEVFGALQQDHPDEAHNVKNELREMARSKKKFSTVVKPISSSDRRTLDQAIAIANELASRSMLDLDRPGKHSNTNNSLDDISSPRTPNSPTHRRKFSFILGSGKSNERERRNYSQEAASIPDIQSTLTEEAKEAYNSLVEKPSMGFLTPSYENKSMSFHFPEKSSSSSKKSELFESSDASLPASFISSPSTSSTSNLKSSNLSSLSSPRKPKQRSLSLSRNDTDEEEEEVDGNPLRLLRQNKACGGPNVLPLPPREKYGRSIVGSNGSSTTRHQRKHPLLIPAKIPISFDPPPPPPKPVRQHLPSSSSTLSLRSTPEKETNASQIKLQNRESQNSISDREESPGTEILEKKDSATAIENISSITAQIQTILHNSDNINDGSEGEPPQADTVTSSSSVDTVQSQITTTAAVAATTTMTKAKTYRLMSALLSSKEIPLYENFGSTGDTTTMNQSESHIFNASHDRQKSSSSTISNSSIPASSESSVKTPPIENRAAKTNGNVNGNSGTSNVSSNENSNGGVHTESVPTVREVIAMHSRNNSSISATGNDFGFDKGLKKLSVNSNISSFSTASSGSEIAINNSTAPAIAIAEKVRTTNDEILDNAIKVNTAIPASSFTFVSTREFSPAKVKTVQRILGSTTTEQDCEWALDATNGDSAHAVKLLRLKALLPESLLIEDIARVVSVLEMSHWDVARAAAFLLNNPKSSKSCKIKTRSELLTARANVNTSNCEDISNNNLGVNSNNDSISGESKRDYIRPTRV